MNDNDRRIVSFTAAAHGLVHTYELSIPILMALWLAEFSVTAATLGIVVTIGYALFGIGAVPGGVLVDRSSPKRLIQLCLVGMAVAFLVVSAAPNLAVLTVGIALWGITASVYHPAGMTLISTGVSRPGIGFGYHGVGGNVGIALGPLATALLLLQFDWRVAAAVLTVPTVLVVGYGLVVSFDETAGVDGTDRTADDSESARTLASVVTDSRKLFTFAFLVVFVLVTFSGLFYRAFLTFLPDLLGGFLADVVDVQLFDPDSPYAEEFDLSRYLYAAILMVGVAGQYLGGRLADRVPPERGLAYGFGTLAVLAVVFVPAVAVGLVPFLAVALLLGVALFAIQPLEQATIAVYSSTETRGLSYGYTFLAIFGIGALGATLAGAVLTQANATVLFLVLGLIATIAGTLAFALWRIEL